MTRFALSLLSALTLASCASGTTDPSTPAAPVETASADAGDKAHTLAFTAEGRAYVLLSNEADVENVTGAPVVRAIGETVVVERTPGAKSAAEDVWLGRVVRLYGASGAVCEGVVHRSVLIGRYSPSTDTLAKLKGEASEDEQPLTPDEIVEEAWSGATGATAVVLAGEVDTTGCDGAIWAGSADVPAPVVHAVTTPDIDVERQYLARFRALPSWAETQRQYDEEPRENQAPRWDGHGDSSPVVNMVDLGTSKMVFVTAEVGEGCGDFSARSTAVFREDGSGVTLMGISESAFVPLGVSDVDGDGTVELVVPGGLRHVGEGNYDDLKSLEVPYLGCPC